MWPVNLARFAKKIYFRGTTVLNPLKIDPDKPSLRRMQIKPKRDLNTFLFYVLALMVLFLGCSPKFSNVAVPVDDIQDFSYTGKAVLEEKWWTSFQDENLNRLIDGAMQSNFDLAATWQQFLAAKAIVSREAGNKWPEIEASAQSAINFPENDFRGGENTQLGLSASYELDLWGRIRTAVQAEKFRAEASLYDYRTAALSLSAEIANIWSSFSPRKSN